MIPWCDRVDPYLPARQITCCHQRDAVDARFGGGVRRLSNLSVEGGNGRGQDDGPLSPSMISLPLMTEADKRRTL